MKHIYTYGGQPAQRHLTVGCILENKAAGKRVTQVTAFAVEEAAAAADARIETLTIGCDTVEDIRAAAMGGSFPDADMTVFMASDELDKLREGVDKHQPVHS